MNFKELSEVLKRSQSIEVTPPNELLGVLDQFAELLQKDADIGAKIWGSPTSKYLKVYPKHQPDRGGNILSFRIDEVSIEVRTDPPRTVVRAEDLEKCLAEFATTKSFRETLENLQAMALNPVEARLDSRARVYVKVSAEDQAKLGEAEVGTSVELTVERIDLPGNGKPPKSAKHLYSAGLQAKVEEVATVDGSDDVLALKVTKEKDAD